MKPLTAGIIRSIFGQETIPVNELFIPFSEHEKIVQELKQNNKSCQECFGREQELLSRINKLIEKYEKELDDLPTNPYFDGINKANEIRKVMKAKLEVLKELQ